MLEQVEIGHYAKIPVHIARANVSETAKAVWREMAFYSSPEKPEVWVRQESLAEKLNLSVRTIRRLLNDLEKEKLITQNGWMNGRYKKYTLAWFSNTTTGGQRFPTTSAMDVRGRGTFLTNIGQSCPGTSDTDVRSRGTLTSAHPGHACPPIIKELTKQEQKKEIIFFNPEAQVQNLLANWGDQWRKRFACLDGLSGRPSIETSVEQAMSHESRHKYASPKVWCEIWLQNAARQWLIAFNREQNAPATDPSLDAEAKARRSRAETERSQRYYQQPASTPVFETQAISAELQAEVDKIMAENETGFADKLMRLMKQQKMKPQETCVA